MQTILTEAKLGYFANNEKQRPLLFKSNIYSINMNNEVTWFTESIQGESLHP